MRYLKKVTTSKLPKIYGSITNTTDIEDKETNAPSLKLLEELISKVTISNIYPVGSIYMSVVDTNPSTLFGGTWERLKDRFLLGAGDSYTLGNTGGSATKTITKANIPNYTLYEAAHTHTQDAHSHGIPSYGSSNGSGSGISHEDATSTITNWNAYTTNTCQATNQNTTIKVTSGGSGTALDIMPPYTVVYMWKKISDDTLITFTIAETNYYAEEGMTWGEWVDSDYNTDVFTIQDDHIYSPTETSKTVRYGDTNYVTTDEVITEDYEYRLEYMLPSPIV